MSGTARSSRDDAFLRAAILGLGLAAAVGVLRALLTLDLHVPFDPNEGWNAYHALDAISGGPLYPAAGSFLFNNYPPLSFYLVGALGLVTHDNILAGRIVSLAAFLLTGAGIAASARALGAGRMAGLWGALFFLVILSFDTSYAGMNDPQLLGHALGVAGLWVALARPQGTAAMALAALLFSLSVFTKHSLVVLPASLFLWLLLVDRPAASRLGWAGVMCAGLGAAAFAILYHRSLWDALTPPRLYSLADSWNGLRGWLLVCGLPLAASLAALLARRDRAALFCLLYLTLSLAAGIWFEGAADTSNNVLFDNLIALGLCAALGFEHLSRHARGAWPAPLFVACFVLPAAGMLGLRAAQDDFYPRYWLDRGDQAVIMASRDIELVRGQPGPVLCGNLALCYWAGKEAVLDEYGMNQALLTGRRKAGELESAIVSGRYAMIVLDEYYSALWSGPMLGAIRSRYRFLHRDRFGAFWVRR